MQMNGFVLILDLYSVKCNLMPQKQYINADTSRKVVIMKSTSERNTYFQKLYPTVNNDDLLEFRIPPNQKSNMCLSNVLLRFIIRLPQPSEANVELLPENYLGAKQFSSLEVRINGEAVTRRNCANEYLHSVNFQYLTNFATDYVTTSCGTLGIFDDAGWNTADLTDPKHGATKKSQLVESRSGVNDDFVYEIVMPLDSCVFTSNQRLPTKTPIELSFERCKSSLSTLLTGETRTTIRNVLELEDAFLLVPYTTDLEMEEMEKTISTTSVKVKYDDYSINRFNISKDSPNVRIANALTGTLPRKIFFGLMPLEHFTGDFKENSTAFKRHGVKKATLYVDGNVLSGYPMSVSDNTLTIPYIRFQENINRFMNCYSSRSISQKDFSDFCFLFSAEMDACSSGSITFEFDFDETPVDDLVLVTCSIHDRTIEFDSFRNFQLI